MFLQIYRRTHFFVDYFFFDSLYAVLKVVTHTLSIYIPETVHKLSICVCSVHANGLFVLHMNVTICEPATDSIWILFVNVVTGDFLNCYVYTNLAFIFFNSNCSATHFTKNFVNDFDTVANPGFWSGRG